MIELHGVALPAGLPDRLDRRVGSPGIADIGNDNVGAGAGQRLRDRLADVARPAGDEGDLSIEIHGVPQASGRIVPGAVAARNITAMTGDARRSVPLW
ncbi:hypothetical protein [Reyranella soli]|uniref:hypothetical protein n=1 Tax=Reyranella soli TaxID=1230389 RepID=UPI001FE2829F|nr:hypothetical protein [Reyranella soli]